MKVLGAVDLSSPVGLAVPKGSAATASSARGADGVSFGEVLTRMMSDVNQSLRTAEQLSIGALTGEVPVQTVVESVIAAEQKIQLTAAVRDKIVAAYLELSRMPI